MVKHNGAGHAISHVSCKGASLRNRVFHLVMVHMIFNDLTVRSLDLDADQLKGGVFFLCFQIKLGEQRPLRNRRGSGDAPEMNKRHLLNQVRFFQVGVNNIIKLKVIKGEFLGKGDGAEAKKTKNQKFHDGSPFGDIL